MSKNILLIECKDQVGLIHKITDVLYKHNLNIISNNEFVERNHNHFFMRTEYSGFFEEEKLKKELESKLPPGVNIKITPEKKKKIVVLATKEHHCLGELLVRHHFNDLNAEILAVISNYDSLRELAQRFNVPFHFVSHLNKTREEHETELLETIRTMNPEFLVLAKYMRILTPSFISAYKNKIINIHHSFLPAFVGASPYAQAYERGVKIIGATAHFVNESLDEGPIIAQSVIPVGHSQNASDMARAGKDVEKIVLAKSLQLVFEERVFVFGNKTIIFD